MNAPSLMGLVGRVTVLKWVINSSIAINMAILYDILSEKKTARRLSWVVFHRRLQRHPELFELLLGIPIARLGPGDETIHKELRVGDGDKVVELDGLFGQLD